MRCGCNATGGVTTPRSRCRPTVAGVGELLDIKPETLRGWIERVEIDAGERPGVPPNVEARLR